MAKRRNKQRKVMRGSGWELVQARSEAARQVKRIRSEPPESQKIVVREERRAGGKVVTVARGFLLTAADLKKLGKKIKTACSAGGTVGEDHLEVQGRHRDKVVSLLTDAGYDVR